MGGRTRGPRQLQVKPVTGTLVPPAPDYGSAGQARRASSGAPESQPEHPVLLRHQLVRISALPRPQMLRIVPSLL